MKSFATALVPFISSLTLIFLAELGDKTQLLTMTLTTRYRSSQVIAGVSLATALLQLMAVSIGRFASVLMPMQIIKAGAGVLFILFGLWMAWGKDKEEETSSRKRMSPFLTVFSLFFLAELGDKTQLAGIALAAKYDSFFQVWAGATLGMVLANSAGVFIGSRLSKKISPRWLKLAGGIVFILFGVMTLGESLR